VFNVGTPELLVILVIALLVLGPNKLPHAARQVGKVMGELRRLSSGFQAEMRDALQEPLKNEPAPVPPDEEPKKRPRRARPLEASPAELYDDTEPTA